MKAFCKLMEHLETRIGVVFDKLRHTNFIAVDDDGTLRIRAENKVGEWDGDVSHMVSSICQGIEAAANCRIVGGHASQVCYNFYQKFILLGERSERA